MHAQATFFEIVPLTPLKKHFYFENVLLCNNSSKFSLFKHKMGIFSESLFFVNYSIHNLQITTMIILNSMFKFNASSVFLLIY